ncbi:trimeric intracellular cation channel family protein [Leptotrichia sp. OH3620_COT-345]|uniref:trimeric intracellular cation channel family protein n=1 Tax=Leptotrichia sp. OH3620_COT-345 TaxID=2491048 RepID=UPI000F649F45|nr:TRIC cation channel family protein [Leptotrichia sp. OH3620_COT-345]RRD40915.1 trimeric intracellular cation channel family protein [Leptotrichia sp. OH3620_COT-345]
MKFETFLIICNYVGTVAFAASGALKGIKHNLDIFGITLLAILTACGGGILRDILVNQIPDALVNPEALYIAVISSGIICVFMNKIKKRIKISWQKKIKLYRLVIISNLIFDSVGLAAFTLIGANKSISMGLNIVTTATLAVLTGVGGGIVRDLLVTEIPIVLKEDIYAVLAFGGGIVYHIFVIKFKFLRIPTMIVLFIIILVIRLIVIKYKINLPKTKIE